MADRRRQSDRQSKRIPVHYGRDAPEHVGHTKNVSATGIKLEGRQTFPKGAMLQLVIGEPPVQYRGRVMWVKALPPQFAMAGVLPTMGIRFEKPATTT